MPPVESVIDTVVPAQAIAKERQRQTSNIRRRQVTPHKPPQLISVMENGLTKLKVTAELGSVGMVEPGVSETPRRTSP